LKATNTDINYQKNLIARTQFLGGKPLVFLKVLKMVQQP